MVAIYYNNEINTQIRYGLENVYRIFQVFVVGNLVIIMIFLGQAATASLFNLSPLILKIAQAIASRNESIFFIFLGIFTAIGLPILLIMKQRDKLFLIITFPFFLYIFLRVVNQKAELNFDFYKMELITGAIYILLILSLSVTHVKFDFFLLKSVLNVIVVTSTIIGLSSKSAVFTSVFDGGLGFTSRMQGILASPTIYGFVTSLGCIIYGYEYLQKKGSLRLALALLFFSNTILTGSRGALLVVALALASYGLAGVHFAAVIAKKYLSFLMVLVFFTPIFVLQGISLLGFKEREVFYKISKDFFSISNLVGVGPLSLTTKEFINSSYLHNQLLQVVVEYGIIGLMLFIFMFVLWRSKLVHLSLEVKRIVYPLLTWGALSLIGENPIRIHTPLYSFTTIIFIYIIKISTNAEGLFNLKPKIDTKKLEEIK